MLLAPLEEHERHEQERRGDSEPTIRPLPQPSALPRSSPKISAKSPRRR
jgi:hypothetical protein